MQKHKIIKISSTGRGENRIIELDDGNVFRISEDVFVFNPLAVGDKLNAGEVQDLLQRQEDRNIREAAFQLLRYRMRSEHEMRRRLRQKEFSQKSIERGLEWLKDKQFINDNEFALTFARDRVRNKKIGVQALKTELFPHKLDQDLVASVIEKVYHEFPVESLLNNLIQKKKSKDPTKITKKGKKRLVDFLRRKGFAWDDIQKALLKQGIH